MKGLQSVFLTLTLGLGVASVEAEAYSSSDFSAVPPSLTSENTPLVMLAMSVDQQLFYKAYSDYTDLDGDGVVDTTYTDGFRYKGYFNADLCYSYNSTSGYFQVSAEVVQAADTQFSCDVNADGVGDYWSGNFLNWATMARVDMVRHVLFGGKRSTDTSQTVLERSFLPGDVHSFAKVVDHSLPNATPWQHILPSTYGSLTETSVTLCNVSDSNGEPRIRVVEGTFPTWASKELTQCEYESDSSQGAATTADKVQDDMYARVEVCASLLEQNNPSRCREYVDPATGTSYYKPVGLLQLYGENGRIDFGLITGSYHRTRKGGVIRRQIGQISGTGDPAVDEIDLDNGQFTGSAGIIQTLSDIRLTRYDRTTPVYTDCDKPGITIAELESSNGKYHCGNWGNPIAEIYYEALRYFSGETAALGEFSDPTGKGSNVDTDTDFIATLNTEFTWTDPLDSSNYCAKCSIILLSSGSPSFDTDNWSRLTGADVVGLSAASDLLARTNQVGDAEYGGDFTGQHVAQSGGTCVSTTVENLSDMTGICPDAPQTQGGYHLAGLAYHAQITDLRTTFDGMQKVNTFALELGDNVPAIEFKLAGQDINLIPTCQSRPAGGSNSDYLGCSLYNMIIEEADYTADGELKEAEYVLFWEDSLWGNDYDLDGAQRLRVCTAHAVTDSASDCYGLTLASGEFQVKQQWVYTAAGFYLRSSYAAVGTQSDGLNTDWTQKTDTNVGSGTVFSFDTDDTPIASTTRNYAVDAGSTSATLVQNPLYLAAKYGGFTDLNDNQVPDQTEEWDRLDNATGLLGSDGIPDQYYKLRDPTNLNNQLNRVFATIIQRVTAGSNAAVVANRSTGNGAIYQALYYPQRSSGDRSVSWVGQLHSLFVDRAGLIREDSNGNGVLDAYPTTETVNLADLESDNVDYDFIIEVFYDEDNQDTYFQRYVLYSTMSGGTEDISRIAYPVGASQRLQQLKPVWNTALELSNLTDTQAAAQRVDYDAYSSPARYLFTTLSSSCDLDGDGTADDNCRSATDFTTANLASLSGPMDVANDASGEAMIDYIRGVDNDTMRSRRLDINNDGQLETWRLGDIIHSTPAVAERPNARYDLLYNDSTYEAFKEQYNNRRRMVYLGANDGMIHGVNGGYWNPACNGFYTQPLTANADGSITCPSTSQVASGDLPLGAELFGYLPENLLPHLRWQAEADYPHVYYMDGEPQVFDARIFANDATHPHGWGTILVVGMRQGGGAMTVNGKTYRSAFVVLDVTDPEQPPEVIAEITHPNLGYSYSVPALVRNYRASAVTYDANGNVEPGSGDYTNPASNKWRLVFGSGPTDLATSTSSQNARLYSYDLSRGGEGEALQLLEVTSAGEGMLLGFDSADWNNDAVDDNVYAGSVTGDIGTGTGITDQAGRVYRLRFDSSMDLGTATLNTLVDVQRPVVSRPSSLRDSDGARWVHFGSGRFYANSDRHTEQQQRVIGVREPYDTSTGSFTNTEVALSTLEDITGVKVFTDGTVKASDGTALVINTETIEDYDELVTAISDVGGWQRQLTAGSGIKAGRMLRAGTTYLDQFIFTEYLPSANQCDVSGRSNLFVVSWKTGTALPYDPLATAAQEDADNDGVIDNAEVSASIDVGVGEFSSGTVFETVTQITLLHDPDDVDALLSGSTPPETYEDAAVDSQNCVFIQSSTGEMLCVRVAPPEVAGLGRQSWRELEILF